MTQGIAAAVAAAEVVPGWMSRAELTWLATRAAALPADSPWLEIGTMVGRSWLCVGRAMPYRSTLACVDIGLGNYVLTPNKYKAAWIWDCDSWTWQQTWAMLDRPDLRLMMHRQSSMDAVQWIPDRSLGAVFIDAGHTYDMTSREIAEYAPKLRPGGLLCGHDYSDSWPGVVQAVDELLPQRELVPGTSLWYVTV